MSEPKATANLAEISIQILLKALGENPHREGLKKTPQRVVKAWDEIYAGYKQNPADILSTVFKDGACIEMVILKQIPFQSMCEHHMMPFEGVAHIGYLPNEKVVGLSKLARLVDCFAHRLQIQEKMTTQIADAMMEHLKPHGAGVIVEAAHQCMSCRGVKKRGAVMVTSAIRGVFKKPEIRAEFLNLIR